MIFSVHTTPGQGPPRAITEFVGVDVSYYHGHIPRRAAILLSNLKPFTVEKYDVYTLITNKKMGGRQCLRIFI